MNITVRRNCSSVVISVPGEWPTKEGPCLMRWLFFFPLLKKHFVCLIWWNFSLHLRDHEKLVPQQRQSFIVSHEPFVVRWGKFWRYRSHRSPLEITSSFLWILWILPLLQRSISSIYLLGFFGGSFFVSSLKCHQLLLTTEIELQRQVMGTVFQEMWWLAARDCWFSSDD